MIKPKGSIFISIGSAGLVVLGGLGILISPFVITLTVWAGTLLRGFDQILASLLDGRSYPIGTLAGRAISGAGIIVGVLLLLFSVLQLTCGLLI